MKQRSAATTAELTTTLAELTSLRGAHSSLEKQHEELEKAHEGTLEELAEKQKVINQAVQAGCKCVIS